MSWEEIQEVVSFAHHCAIILSTLISMDEYGVGSIGSEEVSLPLYGYFGGEASSAGACRVS